MFDQARKLLRAAFLSTAVSIALPAYGQKDQFALVAATSSEIADEAHSALDKFDRFVSTVDDVCERYCESIEDAAEDIEEAVEAGFAVLNGEALVLDQSIIDKINADADRLAQLSGEPPPEPRRVWRRLQLLSRMEHHEQDNEQIFPRSARTRRSHGFGQYRAA
ncbi:hypothetical protein [Hoeflea sp.]|uniref:hypothetical protein n=1 Tax=Hoeflea sp. TaxID=1940281 RepID=UPI003B52B9DC